MPRYLRIVASLICLNAIAVGWSIIHRQVLAAPRAQEAGADFYREVSTVVHDKSKVEPTSKPALPPNESLEASVVPVSDDDPLMQEIRKHAANQFPELSMAAALTSPVRNAASAADGSTIKDMQLLEQRLQVIDHLNQAALHLAQIAIVHVQQGEVSQADSALAQFHQLKSLMIDLLKQ